MLFRNLLVKSLSVSSLNIIGNFFQFGSVVLISRKMGIEIFSEFTLILTIIIISESVFKFQLWQPIIYYYHKNGEKKLMLKVLLNNGFNLEIFTNLFTVIFSTVIYLFFYSHILNGFTFFLLVVPSLFKATAISTTISRIFNKLQFYSIITSFFYFIRLFFYFFSDTITEIAVSFFLSEILFIVMQGMFIYFSLYKNDIGFRPTFSLNYFYRNKGFRDFLILGNFQLSIKTVSKYLDIFIVNYFLPLNYVGYLKIVKSTSQIFNQIMDPIYQLVYPIFTDKRNTIHTKQLLFYPAGFFFFFSLVFLTFFYFFGKEINLIVWGIKSSELFFTMFIYLIAVSIQLITITFHPFLLSKNRSKDALYILIISEFIYLISLPFLLHKAGLVGVSMAFVLFYVIWSILTFVKVIKLI
jgi:O-antigen/teichoic acid export membrane protein